MAASETSNQPYPGFTIPPGTNTLRLPESPVLTYEPGSGWFFSEGKGLVEGDFIIDDADAFKFVIGDPDAFQTVVKPPNDAPVVIFEESDERVIVEGAKFEVYEDDAGKYRFRLRAGDGGVVAVGEPYDTMAAAKEACAAVQRAAASATVVEADN